MDGIHKNIVRFKVSFDAGSESVYNITRRGGDWNKLLENSQYIINWKQKTYSKMKVTANFVVQNSNYRDMIDYVELCDSMGFDEINFQMVNDWGTWTDRPDATGPTITLFDQHAVWKKDHPNHEDFLTYLNPPGLNNKKVNLTNLNDLKNANK